MYNKSSAQTREIVLAARGGREKPSLQLESRPSDYMEDAVPLGKEESRMANDQ